MTSDILCDVLDAGDLRVSRIALGCMGMSEFYGESDDEESIATIRLAVDSGVVLLDTADVYGMGHNEELVGRAIRCRRDEVAISTKFGFVRDDTGAWVRLDGSASYVRSACEASLRRLGTDYIDLYLQHRVDRRIPIAETVGALSELVTEGKVRSIGLCEVSASTLRDAHATHPIAAVQSEYSLLSRGPEAELLPACADMGVGFLAYSPLSRGMLSGVLPAIDELDSADYRRGLPRFQPDALTHNVALVERLKEIAASHNVTPAQLALGWVLRQSHRLAAIVGTRHRHRLTENLKAIRVAEEPIDWNTIEALFPRGAAVGERYTDPELRLVDR